MYRQNGVDDCEVDEREEVDAAYSRCLAEQANIHFPPEADRDIEGYYAFFVFDPDGIRVEVLWWRRDDMGYLAN